MEKSKEKKLKGKKKFDRKFVWLAGLTLFTAIIWVSLQSYHQLIKKDQLEDVEQLLTPLNPNLNTEVLDKISGQKEYQIGEVAEFLRIEPTPAPFDEEEEEIEEAEETVETEEIESQPSEATQSGEANE